MTMHLSFCAMFRYDNNISDCLRHIPHEFCAYRTREDTQKSYLQTSTTRDTQQQWYAGTRIPYESRQATLTFGTMYDHTDVSEMRGHIPQHATHGKGVHMKKLLQRHLLCGLGGNICHRLCKQRVSTRHFGQRVHQLLIDDRSHHAL